MASSKSLCVRCNSAVSTKDEAVQCDFCERWVHKNCPGGKGNGFPKISDSLIKAINEDNGIGAIHFNCDECRPSMGEKMSILRDLDSFKAGMNARLQALENEISSLKKARAPAAPRFSASAIQDAVEEALEREKKRLSVVLVGLPETNASTVRSDTDKDAVLAISRQLNIDDASVSDVFRDGLLRQSTDPKRPYSRIVKVKFSNKEDKSSFLRGFKAKVGLNSSAYARHDLTRKQRDEDRALREQLKAIRLDFPDIKDDLVIRDGTIYNKATKSVFDPTGSMTDFDENDATSQDEDIVADGPRRSLRGSQPAPVPGHSGFRGGRRGGGAKAGQGGAGRGGGGGKSQ